MTVDLEQTLRPVDSGLPRFPPKWVTLASGDEMVIRQVVRDDVPTLLTHVERDYYDIVASRVYAELLAYHVHADHAGEGCAGGRRGAAGLKSTQGEGDRCLST